MNPLIQIIKPILFKFLTSKAVKDLVIQLLQSYVKKLPTIKLMMY